MHHHTAWHTARSKWLLLSWLLHTWKREFSFPIMPNRSTTFLHRKRLLCTSCVSWRVYVIVQPYQNISKCRLAYYSISSVYSIRQDVNRVIVSIELLPVCNFYILLALGLGRLCSKIRSLCYPPMLPTTSCYTLGSAPLCCINRPLCLEFDLQYSFWHSISNKACLFTAGIHTQFDIANVTRI